MNRIFSTAVALSLFLAGISSCVTYVAQDGTVSTGTIGGGGGVSGAGGTAGAGRSNTATVYIQNRSPVLTDVISHVSIKGAGFTYDSDTSITLTDNLNVLQPMFIPEGTYTVTLTITRTVLSQKSTLKASKKMDFTAGKRQNIRYNGTDIE